MDVSISASVSLENSFTWGWNSQYSYTESVSYTVGAGKDWVVFTALPYDRYSYEVLVAPEPGQSEGNEEAVSEGDIFTILVPRRPATYNASVDYFNRHNGTGFDIGPEILSHTPGAPFSYSRATDWEHLQLGGSGDELRNCVLGQGRRGILSTSRQTAGMGGGSVSRIHVEAACSEGYVWANGQAVKTEFEAQAGIYTTGASATVRGEQSYEMSSTDGVFLEGAVASIPGGLENSDLDFLWGLVLFQASAGTSQTFSVLTYWVEHTDYVPFQ